MLEAPRLTRRRRRQLWFGGFRAQIIASIIKLGGNETRHPIDAHVLCAGGAVPERTGSVVADADAYADADSGEDADADAEEGLGGRLPRARW